MSSILACHSKGDRRFSDPYAKLADGRTIEDVYQSAKRNKNKMPYPKGNAKGKPAHFLHLLGKDYPCSHAMRHAFYTMLWWIWLVENPELAEKAASYEGFQDIYDGQHGIIYKKGITSIFPDPIEGSCCQALAIAFLVSEDSIMFLPHILNQAKEAYWVRNHKEPFTGATS
jgi:hypothetical protein